MKAIITKYHGATNTKPARYSASDCDGNRVYLSEPIECSEDYKTYHAQAALALCRKMNWKGELVAGATKDGYVFVFVDGERRFHAPERIFEYETLGDVKAANKAIGHHFFKRATMRFFRCKIESRLILGKFFVTSERGPHQDRKRYTIREAKPDGTIDTIGEFQEYSTLKQAKDAIFSEA